MIFDFQFINKTLTALIGLTGAWIACWIYYADKKSAVNRGFPLFIIPVLLWIIFYNLAFWVEQYDIRLLLTRLTFSSAFVFFIGFYYFFIVWFLKERGWYLFLGKIIIAFEITAGFICAFTDLFIKGLTVGKWGIIPIFSTLGTIVFHVSTTILTFFIVSVLIIKYSKLPQQMRLKVQLFLIGVFIFVGGVFFFGVILPFLFGQSDYYHIANYFSLPLFGFTAYTIVKRKLFGIKVILTYLLVALIAILLALDTLVFTSQITFQILKTGILVIFLYFGYLLIKSVLQEIKRREELEKLTSQLETAHIKLASAYRKLQKLDKAKSEFVSIASHQLRTPLTAIKGYISMLLENTYGDLPDKAKRPMENVYKSNERLIALVNDLLSVSRIESGKTKPEFKKASVEDIISSVAQELEMKAKKQGLALKWKKPTEPLPKAMVDESQIRQVIINIIDNAIRYTKSGYVSITAKSKIQNSKFKDKGKIIIEIKDTGEGLTSEEISDIFESFSRGKSARLWTEGAGLGLYVAKKFVRMHKGKIWAESPGKSKGSSFYVELPIKIS